MIYSEADVDTLETTYRLQLSDGEGGWYEYNAQAEWTTADAVHQLAAEIYGGLDRDEYRLIQISRTIIPAHEPPAEERAEVDADRIAIVEEDAAYRRELDAEAQAELDAEQADAERIAALIERIRADAHNETGQVAMYARFLAAILDDPAPPPPTGIIQDGLDWVFECECGYRERGFTSQAAAQAADRTHICDIRVGA